MKRRLINSINSYSQHLNKVSKWYNRRSDSFGHIDSQTQKSYIYEFYCYIRYVKELHDAQNDIRIDISGAKGNLFPKGPGEYKEGWAKFKIFNGSIIEFVVLGGIKIHHSKISNYSFAPDISIHKQGNLLDENSVILFVDSKYKKKETDEIPIRQLREFKASMVDFNLPKSIGNLKLTGTSFTKSSIVTNGQVDINHNAYASANNFEQIGNFKP